MSDSVQNLSLREGDTAMSFTESLVVAFWKYLRLLQILILMVLVYLAFYGVTLYRLYDRKLAARMEFVAKLLTVKPAVKSGVDQPGDITYDEFENWAQQHDFRFYASCLADPNRPTTNPEKERDLFGKVWFNSNGAPMPATQTEKDEFKKFIVETLAPATAAKTDAEVDTDLRKLRPQLLRWFPHGESPHENPSWWSRFFKSDFRTKGVDLADPPGGLKDWKAKARQYLEYNDLIGSFRAAPFNIQILPWELIRFFDKTRYDLNNGLPVAFGSILMACNLLLRSRLIDRSLVNLAPKTEGWEQIWSDGGGQESPLIWRFKFSKTSFWWAPLLGAFLMLIIEFFLNDPTQRIEWVVNVPIMMMVGCALPIIWVTLYDLTRAQLSEGFLRHSDEFVRRNLAPFGLGVVGLALVTVWALWYSAVILFPTNKVRGAVQTLFCAATLLLLIPVLINIAKQHNVSENIRRTSGRLADEQKLNRPDAWFLSILFEKLDERYALATMLTTMMPVEVWVFKFFS